MTYFLETDKWGNLHYIEIQIDRMISPPPKTRNQKTHGTSCAKVRNMRQLLALRHKSIQMSAEIAKWPHIAALNPRGRDFTRSP
jgi:hypothetical protein